MKKIDHAFVPLSRNGFTLIELAVAMAVLAALAALGVPAIASRLPDYRLRHAARDLYSSLQYAKMAAVRDNRPWAVVFDPENDRYRICSESGPDNDWRTVGDNTVDRVVLLAAYGSGVRFGHGAAAVPIATSFGSDHVTYRVPRANVVQFNARGTCSSGYVYLENSARSAYGVGTRWTGAIRILRWFPSPGAWQ